MPTIATAIINSIRENPAFDFMRVLLFVGMNVSNLLMQFHQCPTNGHFCGSSGVACTWPALRAHSLCDADDVFYCPGTVWNRGTMELEFQGKDRRMPGSQSGAIPVRGTCMAERTAGAELKGCWRVCAWLHILALCGYRDLIRLHPAGSVLNG